MVLPNDRNGQNVESQLYRRLFVEIIWLKKKIKTLIVNRISVGREGVYVYIVRETGIWPFSGRMAKGKGIILLRYIQS